MTRRWFLTAVSMVSTVGWMSGVVPILCLAASSSLSPQQVYALFSGEEAVALRENLPEDHPDRVVQTLVRAFKAEQMGGNAEVIRLLEPLLTRQQFSGLTEVDTGTHSAQLVVGTVGSFVLWRELLYVLLGRAYYKSQEFQKARHYWSGVPDSSPFAAQAQLGVVWTDLAVHEKKNVETRLDKLDELSATLSAAEKLELQLQKAFYAMELGALDQAVSLAESIRFPGKSIHPLEPIRTKILIQSKLGAYLKGAQEFSFEEKKARLNQILMMAESLPGSLRDPAFSSLVAETSWHFASVKRVHDPVALKNQWMEDLDRADRWLLPWLEKSRSLTKPILSEDAYFLSVATLWEQARLKEAVPRLKELLRFYPQGEFGEDAYQLLGDYFYDNGDFVSAISYYRKLAKIGSPEKAAYGVYKAAWSFYNRDEKWSALRHMERLIINSSSQATLAKEAQNDMLLILAELLPPKKALSEFDFLRFTLEKRLEAQERLAVIYEGMGKYEDAAAVWQLLLSSQPKTESTFRWLNQLLACMLSAGKRSLLPSAFEQNLAHLPGTDSDELRKQHEIFQKEITSLILTIHKEAKKTDDPDIWKATDAFYSSFLSHYPKTSEGDFWYFSAQRQEQLGHTWESIRHYQKAAALPDYPNANDGALSVLRTLRSLADRTEKGDPRMLAAARWYIEHFKATPQRKLAEDMLLDFSDRGQDLEGAFLYLTQVFSEEGDTLEHREQYLAHNQRLYRGEHWEMSHRLSTQLSTLARDPEFVRKLRQFAQESAFQRGFQLGKSLEARTWYQRAASLSSNPMIALKAWYNGIVSHTLPKEAEPLLVQMKAFLKAEATLPNHTSEARQLLSAVHYRGSEAWAAVGEPIERAAALESAAHYEREVGRKFQLKWDAFVLYGSYYERERMEAVLGQLEKEFGDRLRRRDTQLAIAKQLFWNENRNGAWKALLPLLSEKSTFTGAWILLRDLYAFTRESEDEIRLELQQFLQRHRLEVEQSGVFQAFLRELYYPEVNLTKLASYNPSVRRQTASTIPGEAELKTSVASVTEILRSLDQRQGELKQHVKSSSRTLSMDVICMASDITLKAARALEELREPEIAVSQWSEFIQKLDQKITGLREASAKERQACERQRSELAFVSASPAPDSPFCPHSQCYPRKPDSPEKIAKIEREFLAAGSSKLDIIQRLASLGAWATAEAQAYTTPSISERSLYLGTIRVALGDLWNGAAFLQEAEKDPGTANHARVLLAAIAWKNGILKVAQSKIFSLEGLSSLSEWEKELIEPIKR